VLASGAVGYGGSVLLQNAGISRTSVTQAALLVGAVPVLVAIIAALWHHTVARPVAWAGFAVSLGGVALITGGHGGGATLGGDGLVLLSLLLSATFTVAQARLLQGRDPVSVTAVQFLGAALAGLTFSAATEGLPPAPHAAGPVLVTAALVLAGTLLPFTLFAYGQSRVSAEVAGAFVNIEPLVGAVAGIVLFGNPAGVVQIAGGLAILAGIALSSLPVIAGTRGFAGEPGLAEGERVGLGARDGERDLEGPVRNGAALADELVQPLFGQRAAALAVGVGPVRLARGLPVDEHAEPDGGSRRGRPHDEVEVASVEAVGDLAWSRVKRGGSFPDRPVARQRPVIAA
jgi:drug/metabolite transporter (DMT)-like permease